MTEDRVPTDEAYRTLTTPSGRGMVAAYPALLDIVRNIEAEAARIGKDEHWLAEQPAPPLDVERLTTVLIEAEADDMLGSEYMPSRLAKYIAVRIGSAPSRSEPADDPISDSRQPEDGPPPGRWPR